MYIAARSGEIAPIITIPKVTAGFIWAPCLSLTVLVDSRKKWKGKIQILKCWIEKEIKGSIYSMHHTAFVGNVHFISETFPWVHFEHWCAHVIGDDFQLKKRKTRDYFRTTTICDRVIRIQFYHPFDTSFFFVRMRVMKWISLMYTKYLANYRFVLYEKKRRKPNGKRERRNCSQEESTIRKKFPNRCNYCTQIMRAVKAIKPMGNWNMLKTQSRKAANAFTDILLFFCFLFC